MGWDTGMETCQGTQHSMTDDVTMHHFPLQYLVQDFISRAEFPYGSNLIET